MTVTGLPETWLTIFDYWDYIQMNECAGLGIRGYPTTGAIGLGCGDYWDQNYRFYLLKAIEKAEKRASKSRWLGFPLKDRYYQKEYLYGQPTALGKYVRHLGVRTDTEVETDVALTLSAAGSPIDPVIFTVTVGFTNANELLVTYPGTTDVLYPSSVSISGTTATIEIPRCRLLKPEFYLDYADVNDRPLYTVDSNFQSTVDIYRRHYDESQGVVYSWMRKTRDLVDYRICLGLFDSDNIIPVGGTVTQTAVGRIETIRMGMLYTEAATYSAGTWTSQALSVNRFPDAVAISYGRAYYQRYEEMDSDIVRAIIGIAHTNMPRDYCDTCAIQTKYWEDDNKPIEPPIRVGLGPSTWGIVEASEIIREFDSDREGYRGGML